MDQPNCDFSFLKEEIIKGLETVSSEIEEGLRTLQNENACVLDKLENLKEQFEQIETLAASFYLNCYLSPFTDKYLDLSTCVQKLSHQKHGALIVIERSIPLDSYIRQGTPIEATLSSSLLESIFYPGNPLHDGAVLVRGSVIVSAANVLPLSEKIIVGRKIGTRHRAAIGISELTDALALVVSEETGTVSFAMDGKLYRIVTASSLV